MKPTTPTTTTLPARSDSSTLAKYHRPGEPIVIVKFTGVGNPSPYDFRAKDNRSYIFRFESKLQGHTLRVPLNLWQQNNAKLAHDMLDERRLPHPIVITLEVPEPSKLPEMGGPDTNTAPRIVVGPSAETTGPLAGAVSTADLIVIFQAAHELVESPKRIKSLAALLAVEESTLRDAIALPESQVELAAAGWVRRKS